MKEINYKSDLMLLEVAYKYMGLIAGLIWPLLLFLKEMELVIFLQVFSIILIITFFNILSIRSLLKGNNLVSNKFFIGISNIVLITLLIYFTGGYNSNLWIMFIFPLITISLICKKKELLSATLLVGIILTLFCFFQIKNLQIEHIVWLSLKISIFFVISVIFRKLVDLEKDYQNKFEIKSWELREHQHYITNIIESMIDCLIVIGPDNKIKTVNHAVLNLLKYKEKDLIGEKIENILSNKEFLNENHLKELLQKGFINDCNLMFITKDGNEIPVSFNASVMKDEYGGKIGIVGIASDIRAIKMLVDDLQKAEREIKKYSISLEKKVEERTKEITSLIALERHKMESFVESMNEGVIMTDENDKLIFLNPMAKKIIGINSDPIHQKENEQIWESFKNSYLNDLYRELIDGRKDVQLLTKDIELYKPAKLPLKITLSHVKNNKGEKLGIVTLLRDIAKEKELDKMKMDFISIVSHELRTPLTNMKLYVSLMVDETFGDVNNEQKEYLLIMQDNIDRLARIISNLIDLSKIDAGKLYLEKTSLDIPSLIEKICILFKPEIYKKNITFKTNLPSNLSPINADSDIVSQIFINLIENAVKFTPSNGTISVSAQEKGDMVEIVVEDTGKGIASENMKDIFEKFKQIKKTKDSEHQGTCLGLPITKELVLLHEGTINVESQLEKGTKVIFTLPKYKPIIPCIQKPIPSVKSGKEEETKKKGKILIIDDDPGIVKVLKIRLEKDNYNVLTAYNGEEGLIKAIEEIPDLIILDILMPGINGYDVCRKISEDKKTRSIPVIMLTAMGEIKDKLIGYSSGSYDYVVKPFDYKTLAQKIEKAIKQM